MGGAGTHLVEAAAVADTLGQLLDLRHLVSQPLLFIELLGQRLQLREGQLSGSLSGWPLGVFFSMSCGGQGQPGLRPPTPADPPLAGATAAASTVPTDTQLDKDPARSPGSCGLTGSKASRNSHRVRT